MRVRITPGGRLGGEVAVPGDKSIAHRWLILAATAAGTSRLVGLPASLDVRSTAACLAAVAPRGAPALEAWARDAAAAAEGHGSTWNRSERTPPPSTVEVEGEGRAGLRAPGDELDCGNSGTTMRLLAGVLAAAPFRSVLVGDASLSTRPMERVARPLRSMGARVRTAHGHPPVVVEGASLRGVDHRVGPPSAQVKGAVLLAGVAAEGETVVREPAATRDHTERALRALGGPVEVAADAVRVRAFQHAGFGGSVPGDVSAAAFLVGAAGLTGSELTIVGVGLNPSRVRFLDVLERMGVRTERRVLGEQLGEPVGELWVAPGAAPLPTDVGPDEAPLVIDEVPMLALVAAHAPAESRFAGVGELRVKESDRLSAVAEGIRALGGRATVEGDDLVVGGGRLAGGEAAARGDHRIAMALTVGALAAAGPSVVAGIEWADVSFPGFVPTLAGAGARVEPLA